MHSAPTGDAPAWRERQRSLYRHNWVVYANAPLGGPAQALGYFSRYTHRTAIGYERIRAITGDEVIFSVRACLHADIAHVKRCDAKAVGQSTGRCA